MCGMFFTLNKEYIPRLQELNARRGGVNESLTETHLYYFDDKAYIGHYQAPTSTVSRSHPHKYEHRNHGGLDESRMWHNGILKESQIKSLQEKFNTDEEWDTALLHQYIIRKYDLSEIDGSFAVMIEYEYCDQKYLYFARNELVPLFMNREKFILSSVKVPELGVTELIEAGKWHMFVDQESVDIFENYVENNMLNPFTTKNNPYAL